MFCEMQCTIRGEKFTLDYFCVLLVRDGVIFDPDASFDNMHDRKKYERNIESLWYKNIIYNNY
jgi:hypothetical protein